MENFYHVLPKSNSTGARKVLLLAGDAAISHHFWPGRGLNTGLKSAVAIVKMWQKNEPFCWYRLGSMVLVRFNFKLVWLPGFSSKTYMSQVWKKLPHLRKLLEKGCEHTMPLWSLLGSRFFFFWRCPLNQP